MRDNDNDRGGEEKAAVVHNKRAILFTRMHEFDVK